MGSREIVAALLVIAVSACSKPPPTEAQLAAEKDRMAALAKSSLEEERAKDRRVREEASRIAEAMTAQDSTPDANPSGPAAAVEAAQPPATAQWRGPAPAPATAATPTAEDKAIAMATGRIRASLWAPESMRIRSPQTREDNAFVCVEVDAKDKSGGYGGFVPVIVTRDKVLYYKEARPTDAREVADYLEFLTLNDRLKCW